jgi:hypothetical protein
VTFLFTDIEGSTRRWEADAQSMRAALLAHLREVLGDQTCESLVHSGGAMTISAMTTYGYDQIDQARAELARLR